MCNCNCKDHSPDYPSTQDRKNDLNLELYNLNLKRITATRGSQAEHEIQVKIKNIKEELKKIG